ncbi:MAG: MFS transporter, partial [Pseudomonadota bacterium]
MGTHARIPYLSTPPPPRRITPTGIVKEMYDTLANRSFIALFIGALLGAVASGAASVLSFYFMTYFWGFTDIQMGMVFLGTFLAAVIGFVLAPIVTRTIGKKRGAVIVGLV